MGLLRLIRSALAGEVSSAELDARRAAGGAAYGLLEEADASAGDGRSAQLFRLCAWNAFALQTIADSLLDADTEADPPTAGYVPRSTLAFASVCLDEVADWMRRARVAQSDPEARVGVGLPARLPRWHHDEPTRVSEIEGLRRAYEVLEARTETRVDAAGGGRSRADAELRRLCAEMKGAAEYARGLAWRTAGPVDRGEARSKLLEALQHAYELGQLLALPTLAEILRVDQDHAEGVPLVESPSWLQIGTGWSVVDGDGTLVGLVQRVRGDRTTGEFAGIDIALNEGTPDRHISPDEIAAIRRGSIELKR